MARDLPHVLDALLDGVVVLDEGGRVELVNAEASRLLEVSGEAVVGRTAEAAFGEDHPVARVARACRHGDRPVVEAETALVRRHEPPVVVDVAASLLAHESRASEGLVVVLRDRTLQSSLREVFSERERLEAFGRIAAGIAHEVKNPLGGIRGAAEILAARAADDRSREAAGLIVREADRIAALVDDVMVFTRGERLELAPVNIHRVLDEVLDLLAMDPVAAKATVERIYDPSIPELVADADRLIQVFHNLARNGLEAMGDGGGTLTITTRMPVDHHLASDAGGPVPAVLVEIRDTGGGIPEEHLSRISTPFFTTRASGMGLGLAVSRYWVDRHGGTLRIESRPGEGTCVRVALPLRRPA